jgi:excisionase family DNA binding protein
MTVEKTALMTTEEVAEFLRMSEVFVTKMAREGKLPGFRMGIKWRFRRETIDSYVKSLENGRNAGVDSTEYAQPQELSKAS